MGGSGSLSTLVSLPPIGPILEIALKIVKALVAAIKAIAEELGIIEPEEDVEELGDKALQSDMEESDFETYDEYMQYIRNIELDPEKSATFSEHEKLAMGGNVLVKAIEENKNINMGEFMLNIATKNPDYYTGDRLMKYIDVFTEAGVSLDKISDLESGKITDREEKKEIYALINEADIVLE